MSNAAIASAKNATATEPEPIMQNIKFKQESSTLVQTLWGFGLVVMVVLGIGGTIYKLIAPNGWIAAFMGAHFSGAVVALGLLIVFSALGWLVRASTSTRQQSGVADLVAVEALDRAGHDVGGGVADDVEAFGAVFLDQEDRALRGERAVKVHDLAVDLGGQDNFGQALGDRFGDLEGVGAVRVLLHRSVGEGDFHSHKGRESYWNLRGESIRGLSGREGD